MLRAMFGMGGTEIVVILIVALLFLGPDKLPEAAKQISKGIRDIKKQSRVLQRTIEDDEHIGGAIRDLKSALRGEDAPVRPPPMNSTNTIAAAAVTAALPEPGTAEHSASAPTPDASATEPAQTETAAQAEADAGDVRPRITLPATAGEPDDDVPATTIDDDAALAALVKPAPNTIARGAPSDPEAPEPKHG